MKPLSKVLAAILIHAIVIALALSQSLRTPQRREVTVKMTTRETIQGKLVGLSSDALEVEDARARHVRLNINAVASIIFTKPSDGEWTLSNQGALKLYGTVGASKDKNVFLMLNQHQNRNWTVGFGLSIPSLLVRDGLSPVTVKLDGIDAHSDGAGQGANYIWSGTQDGMAAVLKLVDATEFIRSLESASTLEVEYVSRDYRTIVIKFDVQGLTKALVNFRALK